MYGREPLAEVAAVTSDGSGFNGFALAHIVGPAIEIDQSIEQASTEGAELSKAGQKTSWGVTLATSKIQKVFSGKLPSTHFSGQNLEMKINDKLIKFWRLIGILSPAFLAVYLKSTQSG